MKNENGSSYVRRRKIQDVISIIVATVLTITLNLAYWNRESQRESDSSNSTMNVYALQNIVETTTEVADSVSIPQISTEKPVVSKVLPEKKETSISLISGSVMYSHKWSTTAKAAKMVANKSVSALTTTTVTTVTTTTTVETTTVATTTETIPEPTEVAIEVVPEEEFPVEEPVIVEEQPASEEVSVSEESTVSTYAEYGITDAEFVLLCNVVGHEYGSDYVPVEEKAKVVEVIMNRVQSPLYPNTIAEVILQPGQFSGAYSYAYSSTYTYQVTSSVIEAVNYYFTYLPYHGYLYFCGDGTWNYFS